METKPLIVNCCHCRWCQRETGTAFALNALIEDNAVTQLGGEPEMIAAPSESGDGQLFARCPKCQIAVWSDYSEPLLRFVKVGTLDQPEHCPPDIQIYTASKQPWVVLPEGMPATEGRYKWKDVWSKESLERWEAKKQIAGRKGKI